MCSSSLLTINHESCDLLPEGRAVFCHLNALRLADSQAVAQTPGVCEHFADQLIFVMVWMIRHDQHQFASRESYFIN